MTPDDVINSPEGQYTQARPNTVFELGYFCGRIGRERVVLLVKEGTLIHSDLDGVGRIQFINSVDEAVVELERELETARLISHNN